MEEAKPAALAVAERGCKGPAAASPLEFESIREGMVKEGTPPGQCVPAQEAGVNVSAFTNVPNEILIQILEYITDDEHIFALARVSRRLHYAALPVFLARKACGVRPADQLVTGSYNARDALRGIRIALFRPALARLYFTVDCRKTDAALSAEIGVLASALVKLSVLREMVISFRDTSACGAETYGFLGALSTASLAALLDAVRDVGCRRVTVRHCGSQNPALEHLSAGLENAHGTTRSLSGWLLQRIVDSIMPAPAPTVRNPNLKVFHLYSPMAFHPHLYDWTMETLNHAALDTLSISEQQGTAPRVWELVLPRVRIPALAVLALDFAAIDTTTLLAFLARHPHLRALHIARNFIPPTVVSPRRIGKALVGLTHLAAPPHWLEYLLSTPGALPALTSARVLVYVPAGRRIDFAAFDGALKGSLARLATLKEVWLSLAVGAASSDWVSRWSPAAGGVPPLCALVTRMDVSVKVYLLPPMLAARLPAWLTQFPLLRRFELLLLAKQADDAPARAELARAIARACPRSDSVEFGIMQDL
ncbi:hypothetical protein HYPSUDRAFT_68038 [Hypholoma sublateritium FD-334 SS-4]|uniref:F-box domain-containing protein n=1 Tax=Hypholoma sublateritium (strain FD-334 SS-4) TaxID=945553 RepID=A0A0D2L2V0_HYPSF|nr:hypothetical protein HYPSUDRAFT_68038 [Hypholoma sublateritium FD-334 SS-4]